MKRITSRENPLFREALKVGQSSRERRKSRKTVLDGLHLLEAYVASGGKPEAVLLSGRGATDSEIVAYLRAHPELPVMQLADTLFQELAQVVTPTGVLSLVASPEPEPLPKKIENCLLLEDIQDTGNLGSILRTAAAAGIRQVFLSAGCAFAWSPRVLRAGMGAQFKLHVWEAVDLVEIARSFQGTVLATALRSRKSVYAEDLRGPTAWIFGNEGTGISDALLAAATRKVEIPMPGKTESLNVAAAVAVCLYEQVRQRIAK